MERSFDDILDQIQHLHVLTIGDSMLDRYIQGTRKGRSPEANVPLLEIVREYDHLGGAANVASNVNALGATSYLISLVGDDAEGRKLGELLKEEGVEARNIQSDNRPTTLKERIIGADEHFLRLDRECTDPIDFKTEALILDHTRSLIDKVDLIILQDYNKGIFTESLIHGLLDLARNANIFTAVDPKFTNFLCYHGVSLFKPNLREFYMALAEPADHHDHQKLRQLVTQLQENMQFENLLLTLSEQGVYYYNKEKEGKIESIPIQVKDVSGAGDVVITTASMAMASGCSLEQAARLANLAGGMCCQHMGVSIIDVKELKQMLDAHLSC